MTLSRSEQERYERLASLEEQAGGSGTGGKSHRGNEAAAIGQQMLLEAFGDDAAVQRALRGGRPNLEGKSAAGAESPTIRVRVTPARRLQLDVLKTQMNRAHTSDVVRDALDEYVAKHLHKSA
jgi:hypothetical protein